MPEKRRYEAIVYFEGPLSKWRGAPDERELIWRKSAHFCAVAIVLARARARGLAHCLWLVRNPEGKVIAGQLPVRASL